MYHIEHTTSSLIREIEYDEDLERLYVHFHKYWTECLLYFDVPIEYFIAMSEASSLGKFYNKMIKNNFNFTNMADLKGKTQNKASSEERWFEFSIDVSKIKKELLLVGEKGTYMTGKIRLLGDGETDDYGNCMMITQKVPTDIYNKEVKDKVPKDKRMKGPILGNGLEWIPKGQEGAPGNEEGLKVGATGASADDLPF